MIKPITVNTAIPRLEGYTRATRNVQIYTVYRIPHYTVLWCRTAIFQSYLSGFRIKFYRSINIIVHKIQFAYIIISKR